MVEDVLGCFRYGDRDTMRIADITGSLGSKPDELKRAMRFMLKNGLLSEAENRMTLTEAGRIEAKRILRAHRLWETYLEQLGTPSSELHDRAHQLEHLHDEETVDYLDDKLGHPLRDPHGALIPEDFVHLIPGAEVKSSLLREGNQGVIKRLGDADPAKLKVGMVITAGARSQEGTRWMFVLPDQSTVQLDHDTADSLIVEFQASADTTTFD